MPPPLRHALVPLVCAVVVACDGGSGGGGATDEAVEADGSTGEPVPAEGPAPSDPGAAEDPDAGLVTEPAPGEIGVPVVPDGGVATPSGPAPEVPPGATLRIDATTLCPTVGETFEIVAEVAAPLADGTPAPAPMDVTASVTLTQSFGEGLELLSRGDGAIALRMTGRNIVGLRADFTDGTQAGAEATASDLSTGRTVYVGGFAADAPSAALMRKPVPRGCLYALRLPDRGFCGTAISRGGPASLGTGDTVVSVDGCEHEAPEGLPVIELDADVRG